VSRLASAFGCATPGNISAFGWFSGGYSAAGHCRRPMREIEASKSAVSPLVLAPPWKWSPDTIATASSDRHPPIAEEPVWRTEGVGPPSGP